MTTTSDYLARLDAALRDVPHGIASEIRAGIAEELASLDPDAAQARIAQLGDPQQIAREAMDADGYAPAVPAPVVAPPAPRPPLARTRGFAIAAAIALGIGGFVVPFVGWVLGVGLVLMSGMWRTWEKLVAILLPFAVMALMTAVSALSAVIESAQEQGASAENPLVPNPADAGWASAVLLSFVLAPVCGLWLLWRMRGRQLDTTLA